MIVELTTPYNDYTHASVQLLDFVNMLIHFRLCYEGGADVRDELNTAPFSGDIMQIAADISAELEAHS